MTPLVSIILPVYNGARHLRPTLDSVVGQPSFDRAELIAINDGSEDSTLAILREYESRHSNIRVIDKPNEGVSITRNRGIEMAKGDYIYFMDADDILHPEAFNVILPQLKPDVVDILVWNYTTFYTKPQFHAITLENIADRTSTYTSGNAFNALVEKGASVSLWLKMFKRSILDDVRFIPGMSYGEDMFFSWKALLKSHNTVFIDCPLYCYRQASGSATSRFHNGLYESYASAFDNLDSFILSHQMQTSELSADLNYHFARRLPSLVAMETRAPYSHSEQVKRIEMIINDRRICQALRSDSRLTGKIYDLAREGRCEQMLRNARQSLFKAKILFPLKRLLK